MEDIKWALAPPALYLAYALCRGEIDGWYAYWFLNPSAPTPLELGASIVCVLALFATIAATAIMLDRRLRERPRIA